MPDLNGRIAVLPDLDTLARCAAEEMVAVGQAALEARGRFMLALSGGNTPRPILRLLASAEMRDQFDWSKTEVFWVDERCVPPDHEDSNYGMAHEELLKHVPVGAVHRMRGEDDPEGAATSYEKLLRERFNAGADETPIFDAMLLGMGPDGHVASLFPGTEALSETKRLVVAPYVPKLKAHRISLTFPVLRAARLALVVVCGNAKRDALGKVLAGGASVADLPIAALVGGKAKLSWLVDAAAACGQI